MVTLIFKYQADKKDNVKGESKIDKQKNLEEEIKSKDKKIEGLQAILEDNDRKSKFLLEEERKDKDKMKSFSKEVEELKKINETLTKANEDLKKLNESLNKTNEDNKKEIDSLNTKNQNLTQTLEIVKKEKESLEKTLNDKVYDDIKQKNVSLMLNVDELKREVDESKKKIEIMKQNEKNNENKVEAKDKEIYNLKMTLNDIKAKQQDHSVKLEKNEQIQFESLRKNEDNLRKKLEELEFDFNKTNKE